MTTRTPTTHEETRPHLRVLEGGLSAAGQQVDEPADAALDAAHLEADIAAAALLCDLLEEDGLRITFDRDPAGGRVRARVVDATGRLSDELSLAQVLSPTHLRVMGAAS